MSDNCSYMYLNFLFPKNKRSPKIRQSSRNETITKIWKQSYFSAIVIFVKNCIMTLLFECDPYVNIGILNIH